jgi:hypothetical protein
MMKLVIITAIIVTVVIVSTISYADADFDFDISNDFFVNIGILNLSSYIELYDESLPPQEQQALLDHMKTMILLLQKYPDHTRYPGEIFPLIMEANALIERGIVPPKPPTLTVQDEDTGEIIFQAFTDNEPKYFEFNPEKWDCVFFEIPTLKCTVRTTE